MQARIKRQGDWALKCTSGHDLERRFIDTINDGFFEQLVLVPMREDVTPDLGLGSAVLTPGASLTPEKSRGWAVASPRVAETRGTQAGLCGIPQLAGPCVVSYSHRRHRQRRGSVPLALVPRTGAGVSQRRPRNSAALRLSDTGSRRACVAPAQIWPRLGQTAGKGYFCSLKQAVFAGVKWERQGRRASFAALG